MPTQGVFLTKVLFEVCPTVGDSKPGGDDHHANMHGTAHTLAQIAGL